MDAKIISLISEWLSLPQEQRDFAVGALYLLKLTGNQILYKNLIADPHRHESVLVYQLQKYYEFHVEECPEQAMEAAASDAVQRNIPLAAAADSQRRGRRADHDALPDNVRACYVENLSLLQRMRELHLRLRSMPEAPAEERRPLLKELIALDKKLHSNWKTYDTYVTA